MIIIIQQVGVKEISHPPTTTVALQGPRTVALKLLPKFGKPVEARGDQ